MSQKGKRIRRFSALTLQSLLKKKTKGNLEKRQGFLFAERLKILGKERKSAQQSKRNRKMKKQGNRKKQGFQGQGEEKQTRTHLV